MRCVHTYANQNLPLKKYTYFHIPLQIALKLEHGDSLLISDLISLPTAAAKGKGKMAAEDGSLPDTVVGLTPVPRALQPTYSDVDHVKGNVSVWQE